MDNPQTPGLKNRQILEQCGVTMIISIKKKKIKADHAKTAGGLDALKNMLKNKK